MLDFTHKENGEQEYRLGAEIQHNGVKALVVRIVDHCCLFEIPLRRYTVNELYVELLTEHGEVTFISLKREVLPVERPEGCTMRAPEPLRREDAL